MKKWINDDLNPGERGTRNSLQPLLPNEQFSQPSMSFFSLSSELRAELTQKRFRKNIVMYKDE